MIGWIALILVVGVVILEIYFRHKDCSCNCSDSTEPIPDNSEKYRKALVEIEEMTKLPKPRTNLKAAVSLLDDIGGTCRNVLGE